jgi:Flp pilus assembly protein protease CpaA
MHPPFPNLPFAIAFVGILVAGLGYAAYVDWTTLKVPKWLTMGLLGTGVVMNMVRGAWLGAEGHPIFILNADNAALGALDGLILALTGFITGFVVFFAFWIFGLGGGGDVKLVAAAGAWLGWFIVLVGIALSLPFLVVVTVVVSAWRISGGRLPATALQGGVRTRTVTTYSLPFALGVGVILTILMVQYVNQLNG